MKVYCVIRKGKNGEKLYLVDRGKTRTCWWTTDFDLAMKYEKYDAVEFACNRLKFGNPTIEDHEVKKIEKKEFDGIDDGTVFPFKIKEEMIKIRKEIFETNAFELSEKECETCKRKFYYANGLYQCICGNID